LSDEDGGWGASTILSGCPHGNITANLDILAQAAPEKTIQLYEEAQSRLFTVQQREKEERPDVEDLTPNAAGRALFD